MTTAVTTAAGRRRWAPVLASALVATTIVALVLGGRLVQLTATPDISFFAVGALLLAAVSASGVGALLASRRPEHPVGWLLLGLGVALAGSTFVEQYVRYGLITRPGSLPGAHWLAGATYAGSVLWLSCAGFVLLLTPTGSLPSPRWRWWAWIAAAAPVVTVVGALVQPDPLAPEHVGNPLAVPAVARLLAIPAVAGVAVVLASLLVGAGTLVGRYRRAVEVERQQLRWLAFAAALGSVLLVAALVAAVSSRDDLVLASASLCVALLPLATGAAIQRYRLYDLDRVVSRTLAYGLLTVLLAGGYGAVVLSLGALFDPGSPVAVAAATLAVATVFRPARRRVQQAVDRRFNRRRYDAAMTVEAFRQQMREEVDLDTVRANLLGVVHQTVQPAGASLSLLLSGPAGLPRRS